MFYRGVVCCVIGVRNNPRSDLRSDVVILHPRCVEDGTVNVNSNYMEMKIRSKDTEQARTSVEC
jgi:hypothetical protein